HYVVGSDVSYGGSLWECLQEHVSQPDWAPSINTASLWRKAKSGATACSGLADGSLCDDGNACNVDSCKAGVCVGSARTCGGSIVATGTDVGSMPGSFGVTPSGSSTFTIPLWTPQGRNELTPSLGLSYSSARGDGVAGLGWAV